MIQYTQCSTMHLLSFTIALLILATILSKSQANHNCYVYGSITTQGSYVVYNQQPRYSQYSYTASCGWWGWSRCTRYGSSVSYVHGSQTLYTVQYRSTSSAICCSGYIGSPPNCSPYCSQGCHQGTCISPNVCLCNIGWTGSSCNTDANECGNANGGCEHYCNNTLGKFTCSCSIGFVLAGNNLNCTDVDECAANTDRCTQMCTNTVGSYQCSCGAGYSLNSDGYTCDEIDECALGTNNCNQVCHNTIGSYYCGCNPGFHLLNNPHICTDVDECSDSSGSGSGSGSGSMHMCSQHCNNTVGSHFCDCYVGYKLQDDGITCTDIDECVLGISGCDHNCSNNIGSFQCSCLIGYMLINERNCIDSNECNTSNGGCDHICLNQIGSYECECRDGYTLGEDLHDCIGDPCPTLSDPLNGAITCTGPQVTDQSCSYTCQNGYNLTGSVTRTCQPDHTWSGDPARCPPLQCIELLGENHAFVVAPCGRDFNTSCNVLCETGFTINGSDTWRQVCQLNDDLGVEWSDPPVCIEITPCQVNPCRNSGTCVVNEGGIEQCECTSLFKGSECQVGLVDIPPIPIITLSKPLVRLSIQGSTNEGNLEVSLVLLNNSLSSNVLLFRPRNNMLTVMPTSGSSTLFAIHVKQQGLFKFKYELSGSATKSTIYNVFEESIVTVLGSQRPASRPEYAYFTRGGLDRGQLEVGCCQYLYQLTESVCSSSLQFISSCAWQGGEISSGALTGGVVFVKTSDINLPLSIAGAQINSFNSKFDFTVPVNQGGQISTCSQCNDCSNCQTGNTSVCYGLDRDVHFDEYDISDMLREHSLFNTFLTQTANLLPSWLSASITSPTTTYSQYDYHASILQAIDAKSHPGCNQLTLEKSGLLYVLKTRISLSLDIAGQIKYLNPAELSPLCFAVDVCSGSESTLEVVLKDKFSLSSINYFSTLSGLDWSFDPYTVSFTDLGVTTAISDPMFWNGEAFIAAKLPSYDFKLQVALNGNLTGGNLVASHSFLGSMLHRAVTKENEVPGQLLGHGNVDIAIQYSNNRDVLYLKLTRQPAIFAYPGTSPTASSAVESGISYQLSYQLVPRQDAVFFSELFAIPDYTQSCPVKLYIRLNNNLGINWANFRTTCLGIRIGMLEFLSNLEHTVTFPGINSPATGPTSPRLYINSTLRTSSLQLGNFFTLLSQGSSAPSIYLAFSGSSSNPTATLYNTNVTVFDNVLNTQVTVEDTNMEFNGQTTIFGSYQTTLKGIASTNVRWSSLPLRYEGTIDGDYRVELNNYLTNYIQDEVNDWKTRRKNAQNSLKNAEQELLLISQKHAAKSEELSSATAEQETLMKTANTLNAQVTQANETYQWALAANSEAQQATIAVNCNEQTVCPFVCQPGVNCTTCYQQTQLVEQGSCTKYKGVSTILQLKKPIKTVVWGYKRICRPCLVIRRWFIFCYVALRECCNTQCLSMVQYKFQHYTAIGYEVISKNEPCVVRTVDTSSPSQCCMQYPCAYTVREPACVASNQQCEEQKQAALGALGSTGTDLSASYAAYTQLKSNTTLAELQVSAKQAEVAGIQQELKIISSARNSAQLGYGISLKEFTTVYEETRSTSPLVQLADTHGVSQLLKVQSLFYNITVTTQTPVAFPVLLTYNKPYAGQSDQITIVINFDAPKLLTMRSLAENLVSQFTEGGSRRKRQSEGAANLLITTFQRSCTDLMNLQEYFNQLSQAVNKTQEQTDTAINAIFEVTATTENAFSFFDSSKDFVSAAVSALQNLSAQREEYSFSEWQTSIGELHNSTTSVGGYTCYGFTDCLHTALSVLQRILAEMPMHEAKKLLSELIEIRERVEDLAVFKNLTLEDAEIRLQEVIAIINKTDELDYWCAGLPEFTVQPPGEVNISVSQTLKLVTTVESELPVRFNWKKNGILLSGHHSSTLTLPNIQMVDAGQYVCLATTDKGTVSSLYSIVNVYYAPIFNLTITPASVREGEDNGVNYACDAHSWPPPGWSWYFRPNSSVAWQLIEGVDANVLPLLSPRLDQEGWYRCKASNWIGNGYREAFLTVLPASVIRINYPVNFKLLETDEEVAIMFEEIDFSGSAERNKKMFRDSLNHSLTEQLSLVTTRVEDVVWTMEFDLSFNFLTPKFVFNNFAEVSVESVLLIAGPSMMNLEADKIRLESMIQESALHVDHDMIRYRAINDTLRFGTRAFVCPAGYGLHSSLVICVSCAPGSYNGAHRIAMTEVSEGQFIQEEMPQCVECPVGTYQQGKGTSECTQCPQYTSTRSAGAKKSSACIDLCEVNYFSSSGLEPCQPCPSDYYQLRRGATDCLPCTNTTTSVEKCPNLKSNRTLNDLSTHSLLHSSPTPMVEIATQENSSAAVIAASVVSVALAGILVVAVVIVNAILLWKRKFKYNINSNATGVPKETTSPIEMADVNSSPQLKAVDTESPLGKFEEVEKEEVKTTDVDNPKSD